MSEISLAGAWTLHDAKGAEAAPCPIPGDIHSALVAAGRIPDPFVGLNEAEIQWVADAAWEVRRNFDLSAADLAGKWAVLDLEFVDTIADLFVNGAVVARLSSSFIRHRVDLTKALKPGRNEIAFRFQPVIAEAKRLAAKQPFPIPWSVSNNRVPDLNMVRKAQCHGGWDWGPCILVMGLYTAPKLRFFDMARIEHAVIRQRHRDDGSVVVTADVELAACRDGRVPVSFTFAGKRISAEAAVTAAAGGAASLSIEVAKPALWWPAGHGEQPLHDAVVEIPGDRIAKKIGLRKIEVINEPDATGLSMTFRVNGIDIFAKGANWIPADALPSRMTAERIRRLLGEAVAANMNMIRVWGGGFYELDAFYDACDELGLLVWQDMMFSCSQYPSTPEFLRQVDAEVRYQVKRLASHASIALWCGDNEVIGSLTWYEPSKKNRDRYLVNYDRFNRAIEQAVLASDPDRRFWPSSPCSGALDYGDAWHDDTKGDMHFWSVWHEGKDFEHYYTVKPRFCSEFGFQSFPTMATIRGFAEPAQWNAMSPVMEFHQRDKGLNGRIVETMTRYFRGPTSFASFVYLSQLQQALAIETAVRYWRSLKPHSMGALYWQLNDVWPAVSWSSLDHALAWKTLHHHAKRFFAPLALSARIEDGKLLVFALSDLHKAQSIDVRIRRLRLDGVVLEEAIVAKKVSPDRPALLKRLPVPPGADSFFVIDAKPAAARSFDPLMRLVVFPEKPKRYDFPAATVKAAPVAGKKGSFTVSADVTAFFIKPEASAFNGAFDDASFTLLPDEKRTIIFRSFDGRQPQAKDLTLVHLAATYA